MFEHEILFDTKRQITDRERNQQKYTFIVSYLYSFPLLLDWNFEHAPSQFLASVKLKLRRNSQNSDRNVITHKTLASVFRHSYDCPSDGTTLHWRYGNVKFRYYLPFINSRRFTSHSFISKHCRVNLKLDRERQRAHAAHAAALFEGK